MRVATFGASSIAGAAFLALVSASAEAAPPTKSGAAPAWQQVADAPHPSIQYDASGAGSLIVMCDNQDGRHTYTLGVFGAAAGAVSGDWVKSSIEGRKKVTVHVKIRPEPGNRARFTASNSVNRYGDNHAEVYDALATMLKAKGDLTFVSGRFRMTVPSAGFADAMRPMIKTCGDPGDLAGKVRARSER
jgi:hypothetical protein